MKQLSLALLLFVGIFSTSTTPASITTHFVPTEEDRIEIAKDQYGVLFTDNFEYVCTSIRNNKTLKSYLDLDFIDKKGNRSYRFAIGFANGSRQGKFFAIEEAVINASRARGLKFNLKLTLSSLYSEFNTDYTLDFIGDESGESLTMIQKGMIDQGVGNGVCEKNELF